MSRQSKNTTKSRLLKAGIAEFAIHGYRGASLRDIAKRADTNVAAVRYHYESKAKLWQAAVEHLYSELAKAIREDESRLKAKSTRDTIRIATRNYIVFSAKNPELYRITLFEMIEGGERLEWLAQYQLREFMERSMAWTSIAQQSGIFPEEIAPLNLVYVMMGAIQTIFMMGPQIERSFGIDVFDDAQVEKHVDTIMRLFRF